MPWLSRVGSATHNDFDHSKAMETVVNSPHTYTSSEFKPCCPPTMAPQGYLLRRTRSTQAHVSPHANFQPTSNPTSYTSGSVTASTTPQNDSPSMFPDYPHYPNGGSLQPSPEAYMGRDVDHVLPPPFNLGDPLLSRKPSTNSMRTANTAMASVMIEGSNKNLMRRLSNRAQKLARPRRQSSTAPRSRDASIGPGVIRRRSDSTNTAPAADTALFTDSDEEPHLEDLADRNSIIAESLARDSSGSTAPSINGSFHDPADGPVIPLALIKGTELCKVSRKSRNKRIFNLESDAGKINWNAKGRSTKSLYIDDIKEVRIGSDIRQNRLDFGIPDEEEGLMFSIFYAIPDKSKSKALHLIAEDEETFEHWVKTLDLISKHREVQMASLMSFNDNAVRTYWNREMARKFENRPHLPEEECLDLPAVNRICRNLHIHLSDKDIQIRFALSNPSRSGKLDLAEFQDFVRNMKCRDDDIGKLYKQLASAPDHGLTWTEFRTFLQVEQEEDVDQNVAAWENKFYRFARRYNPEAIESGALKMSQAAFTAYLTSKDNTHLKRSPSNTTFERTFSRPLNEYFISSSHNTYLIGRQVADVSSVEGYITALVRGCRSVEVDCWDGPDGLPTVKHGFAGARMTNPISFREVIHTINKYAFTVSQFPLWVSLEVHCSGPQQVVMADMMREIFGSRLITTPLDPSDDKLPSPLELRERILIKVKRTHEAHEQRNGTETTGRRRGNSLTSPFSKPVPVDNTQIPAQQISSPLLTPREREASRRLVGTRVETITEGEVHELVSSSTSDCESGDEKRRGKQKTSKIVKSLGELGVYCMGIKFSGFESADCKMNNHILSFMEGTFFRHTKSRESKTALSRHNMRYMMRVYPQFNRLTSNNFNPLVYWKQGVQMTALNWQTFDLGMQINRAMFDGGYDQTGYVLKPESMRSFSLVGQGPVPAEREGKVQRQNMKIAIKVISAHQLMRPSSLAADKTLDPYVEVEVFHANDKRDKHDSMAKFPIDTDTPVACKTHVVKDNGFNPTFDKDFEFNITTKYPELVFVRWSIKIGQAENSKDNNNNRTMATYTAKLSALKGGYRTLPLLDANGDQYLFSTLFCHIKHTPAEEVYITNPDSVVKDTSKFRNLGRSVFRSASNKSSFEKAQPE